MNILFLSLIDINSIEEHNIYSDLLREFRKHGHNVFIVSPVEKRNKRPTEIIEEENTKILKIKIGNIQKTNIIEKGISTIMLEYQLIHGVKKYFSNIKFELVLYPTPPITLGRVVEFVKNRDNAKTYLLLKDIFPQNAVDLGMLSKTGIRGIIYKYFRHKEKKLYSISDRIGCMSQANVDYLIKHNYNINPLYVEVCPNSVEVIDKSVDKQTCVAIRKKYGIPLDKKVFVYGGNLGKPQGIDFLIECLRKLQMHKHAFFMIIGDGTEFSKLEEFIYSAQPKNIKLMKRIPKEDYDSMVGACDVGMIFLDHRFTIPNFPSRLLAYMRAKLPVIACTDVNTDVGKVIVDGGFGWWCESNNVHSFINLVDQIVNSELSDMSSLGYEYLQNNYSVSHGYEIIMNRFN